MLKPITTLILALGLAAAPGFAQSGPGKSPGSQSIVDIAVADPDNFSILVDLVVFAELDGVLSGDGQFTVFAPTNAAFGALIESLNQALGEQATNALLSDKAFITNVLLYHVTDGRRFSNSVVNRNNPKPVEMLNGDYIITRPDLSIADGSALTGNATIQTPNINASNGVIHVIDAVLIP
jgi:transforming growth factor-beta-induced protein